MAFETTHILITKLNLIASHQTNFKGLKGQVISDSIKELKHLQDVLESAKNYQRSNKMIDDRWDRLLDDIYSLEDGLETLLGRTMLPSHKVQRKRHTSSSFPRSLSNKIELLTERVRDYCKQIKPSSSTDSGVPVEDSVPPKMSSTGSECLQVSTDKETVTPNAARIALTDLVKKLSQQLLSRLTLQYLILTVDGAYLGKAILLWTVYSADDIKRHFECHAWVRVSEELGQTEFLLAILKQITGGKGEERLPLQSLQRRLHDSLVLKRFLIVLYGVQTAEFWDNIKAAFPYSLNGSRVITVVQSGNVARKIISGIGRIHYFSSLRKQKGPLLDGWPLSSTYLEEEYGITGVKAEIDKLTQSILNPHSLLFLISIKGMAGFGRTTLLWPVYNAKDVKQHFQCCAWVHVPQDFHEKDILTDTFEQVTNVKLKEKLTVELLRRRLKNFLAEKRYLVVLCDVWTSKIWDNLKLSLPNSLNGSRVIISLSEGEALQTQKKEGESLISGMVLARELPDIKDEQEDFSDQKGTERCDRLSDAKEEESSIVGLDDKVKELAELTLNSDKSHFLISVFGETGSGKTTLVRTTYNSAASKKHFKCRAWVNVPLNLDEFNERQLLIDLLGQLRNAKQRVSLALEHLRQRLRLFLSWKRYLIVLDDVPTPDVWERLNPLFPNLSNGSRVIITARNVYQAYHINPKMVILQLRPLTDDESWALFLKKVQTAKRMRIDINNSRLIMLKEKILQRCHGLPLQIVLLGGLLSRKDKYDEWSRVIHGSIDKLEKEQMGSAEDQMNPSGQSASSDAIQKKEKEVRVMEHEKGSEDQKDFPGQSASSATRQKEEKRKLPTEATSGEDQSNTSDQLTFSHKIPPSNIMALAYQELAPPLKCCLLYLGLFPKSYEIPLRRLYQLWLAEGFVIPTDQVQTPPERVVEYFEELQSRNMLEVTKLKLDGSPKACRVPNTIYDTLFPGTEKVGFFHTSKSSGTWESPWFTIRRLSGNVDTSLQSRYLVYRVRRLHSYISFYGKRGDAPTYGVAKLLSEVGDEGFGMLVVLDLEGVYKPALSDYTIGKLPYLRYLGLRRTLLDDVPQSVGDLSHLETLDIKHTFITKLPNTIWKAKKLQHLYMSDINVDMSTPKLLTSGSLNNLKILWGLVIKKERPHRSWMKSFVGLRKLKLTCNEASYEVTAPWISKMDKLQSLNLRLLDKLNRPLKLRVEDMRKWKQTSLSQLYLLGKIPNKIATSDLPENLEILTLSMTHLSEDPMHALGELKQLKVLRLYARSFLGPKMTSHSGGFPQLRVLKLWMLNELKCWTVQAGAMPVLRELEIRRCKNLKMPDGLKMLSALKELTLTNMEEGFVADVEKSMDSNVAIMKNFHFSPLWE